MLERMGKYLGIWNVMSTLFVLLDSLKGPSMIYTQELGRGD
jgi:hypothetical protein